MVGFSAYMSGLCSSVARVEKTYWRKKEVPSLLRQAV